MVLARGAENGDSRFINVICCYQINPVAQTNKPDLLAHFGSHYCTCHIHTITHQLEKIRHVPYMPFSRGMTRICPHNLTTTVHNANSAGLSRVRTRYPKQLGPLCPDTHLPFVAWFLTRTHVLVNFQPISHRHPLAPPSVRCYDL